MLERLGTRMRRLVGREESGKDGEALALDTTGDEDSELSRPVDREISEDLQPSIVREEEDEGSSDSFFTADGEVEEKEVEQPAGAAFMLTNLHTGESLDLRDENKADFPDKLAKVLTREQQLDTLTLFYQLKQQRNLALWEACKLNRPEVCRDLLDLAKYRSLVAQPNCKGLYDWTALHIAASEGHYKVSAVLLEPENGTDVNARTQLLRTPLHIAALKGHFILVQLLLRKGADPNLKDSEQNTPLHLAASMGHAETVSCLLHSNCNPHTRNSIGKTAWDAAASLEVFEVLSKAVGTGRSGYGRTPFEGVLLHNSRCDHVLGILTRSYRPAEPTELKVMSSKKAKARLARPSLLSTTANYKDFVPLRLLGRGSFGEVYLARKRGSMEYFAMKVLRKDQICEQNLKRYVMTERNILSYIKHPFIVSSRYAFQTPEKLILILDYCPGGDLAQVLEKEGKLEESKAKMYVAEILLALEELHSNGVIYRDLKPENVVLDASGHAMLTDFGLSKEGMEADMLTGSFCGTASYFPPEVLAGKGHSRTIDYYLLGVLLYQLLVGCPPFAAPTRQLLYATIQKNAPKFPRYLSNSVIDLLSKLLAKDPAHRLGSGPLGSEEIKQHPFFHDIDWELVMNRERQSTLMQNAVSPGSVIHSERVYGRMSTHDRLKIDGWSFVRSQIA